MPGFAILVSAVLVFVRADRHTNIITESHTDAAHRLTHATMVGVSKEIRQDMQTLCATMLILCDAYSLLKFFSSMDPLGPWTLPPYSLKLYSS